VSCWFEGPVWTPIGARGDGRIHVSGPTHPPEPHVPGLPLPKVERTSGGTHLNSTTIIMVIKLGIKRALKNQPHHTRKINSRHSLTLTPTGLASLALPHPQTNTVPGLGQHGLRSGSTRSPGRVNTVPGLGQHGLRAGSIRSPGWVNIGLIHRNQHQLPH